MLPQLARLYGIRPGDLDEMPPGEVMAFLDDMRAQAKAARERQAEIDAANARR